jgi:mannose-1-phosphate guanylyltransferase
MLEHTLDRALQVVNSKRILTVTSERHHGWLDPIESKLPGRVISQPGNHGTAPGIFLPASYILENDPSATTLIFPCDHFVFPENRFNSYIKRITEIAEEVEDRMVLVGVKPTRPETDYGWIEPGSVCSQTSENPAMRDKSFREKPNHSGDGNHRRDSYRL